MTGADQSPTPPADSRSPRRVLLEVLLVFGGVTLACAVLYRLQGAVPFIHQNLHGLFAALFLFVPTEVLIRRKISFESCGLTYRPLWRGVLVFLVAAAVVFPLFTLGFYIYYRQVCGAAARGVALPGQIRRYCGQFVGSWTEASVRVSGSLGMKVLTQVLVVALPEEYFFRGYVQTRLEQVWPSRRRLLGVRVGLPLLVASALFALGHLLVDLNGMRLAVFFPGLLFGWMRELTGSILAPVLFHASSNMISEVLHDAFRK